MPTWDVKYPDDDPPQHETSVGHADSDGWSGSEWESEDDEGFEESDGPPSDLDEELEKVIADAVAAHRSKRKL